MANKQPSNLLLLKKLFIYATLFAIATLTWTQLDSITTLYDDRAQLPVDFTLQTERDPATWVIQVLENESSLSQPSIFPADTFSKFNSQRYPSVTAILNRVDDSDEGILHAVDHLFKYPFIKEILVYNQIKSRPLTAEVRAWKREWDACLISVPTTRNYTQTQPPSPATMFVLKSLKRMPLYLTWASLQHVL